MRNCESKRKCSNRLSIGGMNRIKDFCSKMSRKPIFYFCLFFALLNLFYIKQALNSRGMVGGLWICLAGLIIEVGAIVSLYKMRQRAMPIEKQFLLVALVFGVLFAAIVPPGHVPDEGAHFMRAYGVANGEFVARNIGGSAVGGEIPIESDFILRQADKKDRAGTYREMVAELTRGTTGEEVVEMYNTSAVYNFVCYLPQAVGILIGKILGLPVLWMIILARFCNYVIWLILMYFAVKLIPKFKKIVVFMALLPIVLQEAMSLSPDALTIGASVFMIAYVLHLTFVKRGLLSKKERTILCLTAIVIGLCKIVYFPLIFIYLMLPEERFGSRKKKWMQVGGIVSLAIVVGLGWLAISFGMIVETNPGVNAGAQVMGIMGAPLGYLKVMVNTVDFNLFRWLREMLGMQLTSFGLNLPEVFFFVSFSMLVLLMMQRDEKMRMRKIDRWLLSGVFVIIAVMIMTSLYVQWTPYGEEMIGGIQGRYFLPILLLVPVIFCQGKGKRTGQTIVSEDTVLYYGVFVNVMALATVFSQNI